MHAYGADPQPLLLVSFSPAQASTRGHVRMYCRGRIGHKLFRTAASRCAAGPAVGSAPSLLGGGVGAFADAAGIPSPR